MNLKMELVKNVKKFMSSADLLYERRDFTSSCILYFKTLFAVLDYILLITGKGLPKDHTERFNKLKKSFFKLYKNLEKFYPLYRSTYSLSINKEKCKEVRDYVKQLVNEFRIN